MSGDSQLSAPTNGQGQQIEPEALSVRQAAQLLQVSDDFVRDRIHRRQLRAYLLGTQLRIRRSDLEAFMAANEWSPELCRQRTSRPGNRRRKRAKPAAGPAHGETKPAPARSA